jgi:peptidoglycan/xylan/chitin deacetylase (PgdA/CDA1 family)
VVAALVWRPAWWLPGLGLLAANHLLLTAVGMWPRSRALGPNWVRLPDSAARSGQIALTLDDGPDPEVTPRVLDILDRYQAQATFFCIGSRAERHPELCREIVRRGHALENHSQRHLHRFAALGPTRMAAEIEAGQAALTRLAGQPPLFFRAPAGLRSPLLEPILARKGLILASWSRRGFDTRNRDADDVLGRLVKNLAAGDILLLHDGHAARGANGVPLILTVLPRLLEIVRARNLHPVTLRATLPPA